MGLIQGESKGLDYVWLISLCMAHIWAGGASSHVMGEGGVSQQFDFLRNAQSAKFRTWLLLFNPHYWVSICFLLQNGTPFNLYVGVRRHVGHPEAPEAKAYLMLHPLSRGQNNLARRARI